MNEANEKRSSSGPNARTKYFAHITERSKEPIPEAVLAVLRHEAPELGTPATRGEFANRLKRLQEDHYAEKKAEARARRERGLPEPPRARPGEGRNRVPVVDGATRALVRIAQLGSSTWQREQAVVLLSVIKKDILQRIARYHRSIRVDLGGTPHDRDADIWQRVYDYFLGVVERMPTTESASFSDRFDGRINDAMRADERRSIRAKETELMGERIPGRGALDDDAMSAGKEGKNARQVAPAPIEQLPDGSLPYDHDRSAVYPLEILERVVRRGKLTEDDRVFYIEQHALDVTHSESAEARKMSDEASRQRLRRINKIVGDEADAEMDRARKLGLYLPTHERLTPEKSYAERVAEVKEAREYEKKSVEREKRAARPRTFFLANQSGIEVDSLSEITQAQEAIVRELAPRTTEMEAFAAQAGIGFEGWLVGMVDDAWEGIRQGVVASSDRVDGRLCFYDPDAVWHALRYLALLAKGGTSSIENTPVGPTRIRNWRDALEYERRRKRRCERRREQAARAAGTPANTYRSAEAGSPVQRD